jgi:YidC/Oxa1 family membrane protein insertase
MLLAIALMGLFILGWSYFFAPRPQPPVPAVPVAGQEEVPQRKEGASPPLSTSSNGTGGVAASPEGVLALLGPAAAGAAADDEITLRDDYLSLTFTRVGARLKRATVLLGEGGKDSVQLVPEGRGEDASAVYPLGLRFQPDFLGEELDRRRWAAEVREDGRSVVFRYEIAGVARIEKRFAFAENPHVLDVSVSYTNLEGASRRLGLDTSESAFSLYWGPNVSSGDLKHHMAHQEILWHKDGVNTHEATSGMKAEEGRPYFKRVRGAAWTAVKSAYFVVALKPEFSAADVWASGTTEAFRIGLGAPAFDVEAGATETRSFRLYAGPNRSSWLAAAWPGLDSALQFFTMFQIMDWFAKLLLAVLNWFHDHVVANYGLAIIFLTVLVRLVVFPLTYKSMISMKKMQKLQPEMEKIKAEVGDKDPQELQRRIMEMYRERGVNPLSGCLPLLLQMPVFIALYNMLATAYELRHAPFYGWIKDLSAPDALFHLGVSIPIPFMTEPVTTFNLLPFLMAGAMLLNMKFMPSTSASINPQQKTLLYIMPVFFSLICYNMSAGLNLYILTSTLLGIAQSYLIQHIDLDVDVSKQRKTPRWGKPKNFYAAAQARKREAAKETRRAKKEQQKRDGGKPRPTESSNR